jgi:hypothetical protein
MKRVLLLLLLFGAGCATPSASPTSETPPADAGATHGGSADLGKSYRSHTGWADTTQGLRATLVYVSASGSRNSTRPFPVIYSSDPNNTYFYREAGPGLDVRRLYREEMQAFVGALNGEGMATLPWEAHGFRDKISGKRGLYLYKDEGCQRVLKARLSEEAKVVFTRVEKRIIALHRGS